MDRISGLEERKIVHYVLSNGEHTLAMILQIWDYIEGNSDLFIFPNSGVKNIPFDNKEKNINTWHWIE